MVLIKGLRPNYLFEQNFYKKRFMLKTRYICLFLLVLACQFSCQDDDDVLEPFIETDATSYIFARDGRSSVDNIQQTELADMLTSLTAYAESANEGVIVEANIFRAGFENTGNNGGGLFDFMSSIQLENNLSTVDLEDDFFGDFFEQAAIASKAGNDAANGVPGFITRESTGNTVILNNIGQDLGQFIEKGIMGSVFLHQMFNILLSENLVGDEVDNISLVPGENYTELEHNWDIAFGYFQAPGEFGSDWPVSRIEELNFWSTYAEVVDPSLGISDRIMNAFRDGRNAIVENDSLTRNESRAILVSELELLSAATCLHYINRSIVNQEAGNTGDLIHSVSAAYMFARALNMNPGKLIPAAQLHNLLNVDLGLGGNFWRMQEDGLLDAKSRLVEFYPSLEPVQDEL